MEKKLMNTEDFLLPTKVLEKLNASDVKTSILCNSILFGKEIPGLMAVCDNNILDKYNIFEDTKKIGGLKYNLRMLNSTASPPFILYVFEFEIILKNDVVFKLHFNPVSKDFNKFCKLAIQNKMFSIHFENVETKQTYSTHIPLDDTDLDWLKRNIKISENFQPISFFNILSEHLVKLNDNKRAIFFLQNKKIKVAGF